MTLKYLTTEQDWVEFNLYHMRHSKVSKASIDSVRYIGIVVMLLVTYLLVRGSQDASLNWFVTFVMSILWFIYFPDMHKKQVEKQARKLITEDESKGFLGDQVLKVDDEGITVTNEYSCNKMKWSLFNKIKFTDEYIYIYDSSISAIIIPALAFENIEDMKSFYKNVEERLT